MAIGRDMSVSDDAGGRAQRFRVAVLPHLDGLYTLARYLLSNTADAEDAVQECCLRAFRHFDGFRGGAIKPWLFAILRNVCRAEYARRSGVVVGLGDEPDDAAPIWNEARRSPEAEALQHRDDETIRQMIAGLPSAFREVIVLREINELNYREIAEVIDVPVGSVMSRLARARAMLRDAWTRNEGLSP
jgi:RNA polymerase sigma-70 factor (ECF subfamily)